MIEIATIGLTGICVTLLVAYWFRYTCLIIVASNAMRRAVEELASAPRFRLEELRAMIRERSMAELGRFCSIAVANEISFPETQALLCERDITDLDRLRDSLEHDYRVVVERFSHAGRPGESADERKMLALQYRLLSAWYRVRRCFSGHGGRQILEEMSWIVAYFADVECTARAATA